MSIEKFFYSSKRQIIIVVFYFLGSLLFAGSSPKVSPQMALTENEIELLDRLVKKCKGKNIASYMLRISKLGGYLARASEPPPGNVVMLRGLMHLVDIEYGFNLAMKLVGN